MEENGKQYIEGLVRQLANLENRFSILDNTPDFVRQRKGMEAEYLSLKQQRIDLKEKIIQARVKWDEFMAMDEAGASSRMGSSSNIKVIAIVSGVLLVSVIVGALIYKKVRK